MTLAQDSGVGETYTSLMQRHFMNDAEASAVGIRRRSIPRTGC